LVLLIAFNFTAYKEIEIGEWNLDKKLSDHKGIYVELKNNNER